jgi:hypothetical protein
MTAITTNHEVTDTIKLELSVGELELLLKGAEHYARSLTAEAAARGERSPILSVRTWGAIHGAMVQFYEAGIEPTQEEIERSAMIGALESFGVSTSEELAGTQRAMLESWGI